MLLAELVILFGVILETTQIAEIAGLLKNKKIGILPTDTIYGVHCLALDEDLVKKVYAIKKRPLDQPVITAISSIDQLDLFNLEVNDTADSYMKTLWPGPNTLIFKQKAGGTRSFRLPHNSFLTDLISQTGPLISTSANIHGEPLALTIEQARSIFGDQIDFYVNGGTQNGKASTVYDLTSDQVSILRN